MAIAGYDNSLLARFWRVCAAVPDATTYRMLWLSITDNLIKPDAAQVNESIYKDEASCDEVDVDVEENGGIPKTIFQTWKSRKQLPSNFAYWRASFLRLNPSYRHILWDDRDNRQLIAARFPWFIDIYDGLPAEIFRADVVRFFFLYEFGGFYADLDSQCIRPLDDLCHMGDLLVGRMGKDVAFEHSIPNAIMASKPKQVFWLLAIALVSERFIQATRAGRLAEMGPEQLTGPILFKSAVEYYISHAKDEILARAAPVLKHFDSSQYRFGQLTVLPPHIWYPINWANPAHQVLRRKMSKKKVVVVESSAQRSFQNSYVVNYWSHSWDDR